MENFIYKCSFLALPIEDKFLEKKIYEAEDKELYNQKEKDNWYDFNNDKLKLNYNQNSNSNFSKITFDYNYNFNNNINIFSNYSQNQINS